MRSLIFIIFFLTAYDNIYSQNDVESSYGLGMPPEENQTWMSNLKHSEKEQQLASIQKRFFKPTRPIVNKKNDDVPVLVVDGVPISPDMNNPLRRFLAFQLNADDTEIAVLDKEPEGLYVNKRWTGLILLSITNKKTRKRMFKQK